MRRLNRGRRRRTGGKKEEETKGGLVKKGGNEEGRGEGREDEKGMKRGKLEGTSHVTFGGLLKQTDNGCCPVYVPGPP